MLSNLIVFAVVYFFLSSGFSLYSLVAIVVGMVGLFVYTLYTNQESMLYQCKLPNQPVKSEDYPLGFKSPAEYGLSFEELYLTTSDNVRLHAWFIPAHVREGDHYVPIFDRVVKSENDECDGEIVSQGAKKLGATSENISSSSKVSSTSIPTVLFLHANAGTINYRNPNLFVMATCLQTHTLIIDYRGYGLSQGTPSETGLIEDAETALRYLRDDRRDIDISRVYLFGRSLGGAVATALAANDAQRSSNYPPLRGVILENTFTSVSAMVDKLFPVLKSIKPFILRLDWSTFKRIPLLNIPVCLLSGSADEIVPPPQMEEIYSLIPSGLTKCKLTVTGGSHNSTWLEGGLPYIQYYRQFMSVTGAYTPLDQSKNQTEDADLTQFDEDAYDSETSTKLAELIHCKSNHEGLVSVKKPSAAVLEEDSHAFNVLAGFIKPFSANQ